MIQKSKILHGVKKNVQISVFFCGLRGTKIDFGYSFFFCTLDEILEILENDLIKRKKLKKGHNLSKFVKILFFLKNNVCFVCFEGMNWV